MEAMANAKYRKADRSRRITQGNTRIVGEQHHRTCFSLRHVSSAYRGMSRLGSSTLIFLSPTEASFSRGRIKHDHRHSSSLVEQRFSGPPYADWDKLG